MALSYKNDDKKDERLDPYSDSAHRLYEQEKTGYDREFDDIEKNYDKTADASQENANIDTTKNINDVNNQEKEAGGWKNNVTGGNTAGKQNFNAQIKSFVRKKGPMGMILGLVLGGGGGLSLLFSPGALIVHFKEIMADKYNDQLAVMDIRTTALIKKKFEGTTTGFCTSKLSIGCKYNTMSNRQFKELEKSMAEVGGKVNKGTKSIIPNRNKIANIEFDGRPITASNFASELKTNPAFRAAMIKGYNPRLAAFADSIFSKLATKLGINKQKNITGDTEEARRKSILDSANGNKVAEIGAKVTSVEEDCVRGSEGCSDEGKKTVYKDATTGEVISKEVYDERISKSNVLAAEFAARKSLMDTGKVATKATLKGALTVTALGLGAVDSACTGYTLIRTVGFIAKYLGAVQLLRYAHVFMNIADSIKAGDATPEQVEDAGNILTSSNVIGQTATDSYGYKYAAYGDAPQMPRTDDIQAESVDADGNSIQLSEAEKQKILLRDEITKYINGQLVSDNILATLIGTLGNNATTDTMDETCKFVKSGWGQTIIFSVAIVGAVVAFFSGGASIGWGTAAQVAVSVAIGVALAMLTPKLIDMATATMIDDDELTNGNRTGNAVASGMEAYNMQTAQARGLPALQEEDALAYKQLSEQTLAQYNEVDRLNRSPLDPTSSNTFLGSMVAHMLPYTTKLSSLSSSITAMTNFTTSSLASIIPKASAQDANAEFKVCNDRDYKDLNLATAPFCGLRYGMNAETLAIDPEVPLDYMLEHDYIDPDTGAPKDAGNDYAEYIKNCMDRNVSIGGFESEENTNKGEECIQGYHTGDTEYKYTMFRLFYIDNSVNEGMENGEVAQQAQSAESNNGQVVSPVAPGHTITSGYGPRGSVPGASNGSSWHAAIDIVSTPANVYASMAGEVVSVGGSVNAVVIKHADGLKTRYLHMWPEDTLVKVGDKVTAGQKIGTIGCAGQAEGYCAGPHLDFNIWIDEVKDRAKYSKYKVAPEAAGNSSGNAINPANFLKDNGVAGYDEAVNDN
jgi:murein DD-endopeptidase MepM/ murein hydrolase activator NlpD